MQRGRKGESGREQLYFCTFLSFLKKKPINNLTKIKGVPQAGFFGGSFTGNGGAAMWTLATFSPPVQ